MEVIMDKQQIIEYLISWQNQKYYMKNEVNEDNALEILTECSEIAPVEIDRDSRRWWDELTLVGKFGDKYFQYPDAHANRDESPGEVGWKFDWDIVCEVEPYEETITVTKYKIKD